MSLLDELVVDAEQNGLVGDDLEATALAVNAATTPRSEPPGAVTENLRTEIAALLAGIGEAGTRYLS
jgi:hypothetical protein